MKAGFIALDLRDGGNGRRSGLRLAAVREPPCTLDKKSRRDFCVGFFRSFTLSLATAAFRGGFPRAG